MVPRCRFEKIRKKRTPGPNSGKRTPRDFRSYLVIEDAEPEALVALLEHDLLHEGGPHRPAVHVLQALGPDLQRPRGRGERAGDARARPLRGRGRGRPQPGVEVEADRLGRGGAGHEADLGLGLDEELLRGSERGQQALEAAAQDFLKRKEKRRFYRDAVALMNMETEVPLHT